MELLFEKMKNAIKHSVFWIEKLTFVELYIGKWKKHQNQQFSENIVFYVSKLKHTFWASFRGARSLIYICMELGEVST